MRKEKKREVEDWRHERWEETWGNRTFSPSLILNFCRLKLFRAKAPNTSSSSSSSHSSSSSLVISTNIILKMKTSCRYSKAKKSRIVYDPLLNSTLHGYTTISTKTDLLCDTIFRL